MAEAAARRWLVAHGVPQPGPLLSLPATLGVLLWLGHSLFFPCMVQEGLVKQVPAYHTPSHPLPCFKSSVDLYV